MPKVKPYPTAGELSKDFHYDPITGEIRRIRAKPGARMGRRVGTINSDGRRVLRHNYRMLYASRVGWILAHGTDPYPLLIDHVNGDTADDRLCNLRLATAQTNQMNRVSKRDLPKNIYYTPLDKNGKPNPYPYRVRFHLGNGSQNGGTHATLEEAIEAKAVLEKQLFGSLTRHEDYHPPADS